VRAAVPPPQLLGPRDAEVTLIGWGSTDGVIREAAELLQAQGTTVNHLQIKWIVPLHADVVSDVVARAHRAIIVENNFSGQLYRYLRSETAITVDGHIRKYDGEPFMPHHVVEGVQEIMKSGSEIYVPYQEMIV